MEQQQSLSIVNFFPRPRFIMLPMQPPRVMLPTGAPDDTLPTWGMTSPALMPSPGAELNTIGNIRPFGVHLA